MKNKDKQIMTIVKTTNRKDGSQVLTADIDPKTTKQLLDIALKRNTTTLAELMYQYEGFKKKGASDNTLIDAIVAHEIHLALIHMVEKEYKA